MHSREQNESKAAIAIRWTFKQKELEATVHLKD